MTDRYVFIDSDALMHGRIRGLPDRAYRAWFKMISSATREGDTHFTRLRLNTIGVTTAMVHHLRAHGLVTPEGGGWRLSDCGWRPGGPVEGRGDG
jgi:hypothetical protein